MQTETDSPDYDLLTYPPIPLATGDVIRRGRSGEVTAVAGISLHVTTVDGATTAVPLEHRFGGWWLPADEGGAGE